jgi:hypothetical protein
MATRLSPRCQGMMMSTYLQSSSMSNYSVGTCWDTCLVDMSRSGLSSRFAGQQSQHTSIVQQPAPLYPNAASAARPPPAGATIQVTKLMIAINHIISYAIILFS